MSKAQLTVEGLASAVGKDVEFILNLLDPGKKKGMLADSEVNSVIAENIQKVYGGGNKQATRIGLKRTGTLGAKSLGANTKSTSKIGGVVVTSRKKVKPTAVNAWEEESIEEQPVSLSTAVTEDTPSKQATPTTPEKSALSEEKKPASRAKEVKKRKKSLEERETAIASKRRPKKNKSLDNVHVFEKPTEFIAREIEIPEAVVVAELAKMMSVKATEVIKVIMKLGGMATINQTIDQETAILVVEEMGHKAVEATPDSLFENLVDTDALAQEQFASRAPVVTIMGHVDHGKTSLLDKIRSTRVTQGEAGGITQHIGAYHVNTPKGMITFLDTPGHEAFTAMRARGAQCTDIVILVVAADDIQSGLKPQTAEAIQHAKAADVPMVVAINKVDKDTADPERVISQLSQHDVMTEAWGGDVMVFNISAKTGQGIDALLDGIILQAELLELRARHTGVAKGLVVEARLDKHRGPVSTVLVTEGQLQRGDIAVVGAEYGRIRGMVSDTGVSIDSVGPSMPVEILGLSGVPLAGDEMLVVNNEKRAREVSLFRQGQYRDVRLAKRKSARLENFYDKISKEGEASCVNLILKTDVQGSLEAIVDSLHKLSNEEVQVRVVASAVGGITESDANLALASDAIIVGFNVRADQLAKSVIHREKMDLRYYSIIYDLIDDVKKAMTGLLAPEIQEQIVGLAEVRDVFRSSKLGAVAGCMVIDGFVRRQLPIRVLRDSVVIYEGTLESLKRFKDDAKEVRQGMECGIAVKHYNDVKVGDQIECFEKVTVSREHL